MSEKIMELVKSEVPQITALLKLNAAPGVDAQTMALQEIEFLKMAAVTKPEILECLPHTVVLALKSIIKQNLSLDPYAGLVYIKTRNVKMTENGNVVWRKALEIMPTCNGILSVAYQCGKIIDHKIPTVNKNESGRVVSVDLEYQLRTERWEKRKFDESDFMRWRIKSHQENGRGKNDANAQTLNYANANYTNWMGGIDPEFARAKAIKHGLKKLGTNPNERMANVIVMPQEKKVVIDPDKELAAATDGIQECEIISEQTHVHNEAQQEPQQPTIVIPNSNQL